MLVADASCGVTSSWVAIVCCGCLKKSLDMNRVARLTVQACRRYNHNESRMQFEKNLDSTELTQQLWKMFKVLHDKTWDLNYLLSSIGFYCYKAKSSVHGAGYGVHVKTNTLIPAGTIVSIYSGTVYAAGEPTFLPSIGNKFILQRKDGYLIDGNDRFLSKIIHSSCCKRERYYHTKLGKYIEQSDHSWLKFYHHTKLEDMTEPRLTMVKNPYSIGHYINSSHDSRPSEDQQTQQANVMYYEYEFDRDVWDIDLLQYIPNVHYNPQTMYNRDHKGGLVKSIVLVALRDIHDGEELFASYKNLVYYNIYYYYKTK